MSNSRHIVSVYRGPQGAVERATLTEHRADGSHHVWLTVYREQAEALAAYEAQTKQDAERGWPVEM